MQLSDIRTALRRRMGVPSSDSFHTDAVLTDAINESLRALATEHDWPWLDGTQTFSTAADDYQYDLPSGYARTISMQVGAEPATQIHVSSVDDWNAIAETIPAEYAFAIYGGEILLKPTPQSVKTVTHRYVKAETALSSDTDEPLLPDRFIDAAIAGAAYERAMATGNLTEADRWDIAREKWLLRMKNETLRTQGPMRVQIRPGVAW